MGEEITTQFSNKPNHYTLKSLGKRTDLQKVYLTFYILLDQEIHIPNSVSGHFQFLKNHQQPAIFTLKVFFKTITKTILKKHLLKMSITGARKMARQLRALLPGRGPRLDAQHPQDNSQLLTPVLRETNTLIWLPLHQAYMWCAYINTEKTLEHIKRKCLKRQIKLMNK